MLWNQFYLIYPLCFIFKEFYVTKEDEKKRRREKIELFLF